ncbi:MAG: hypothetical protein JW982_12595 [Spirochaetes bacterium]|nr:hypothetical protein [Spirochaetota bacterium]
MTTDISIVTGWGGIYGSGHFRRMLLLAVHLTEKYRYSVEICGKNLPVGNYTGLPVKFKNDYPEKTHLIIHDRRDSTVNEISELQRKAPVITVDDTGEGRFTADRVLDLLPNLEFSREYNRNIFLYGYDFFENLKKIYYEINRDSDFLYYFTGSNDDLNRVRNLIPGKKLMILYNSDVYEKELCQEMKLSVNYTEALFKNEYVITHFGILPYEAILCGCRPVFINPSEYHSKLAAKEAQFRNFLQLGTYEKIRYGADEMMKNLKFDHIKQKPSEAGKQVIENLDRFAEMLSVYL